jgi:PPOX class probable F420-dependent enzyme
MPIAEATPRHRPLATVGCSGMYAYAAIAIGHLTSVQWLVDDATREKILTLLAKHRKLTIATVRSDGWPQVTTVGYGNEGLTIYFLCGPDSQKAKNLARDPRVSLAIDDDTGQVMSIEGLSMAARADVVTDPVEANKALHLMMERYPQQDIPLPMPNASDLKIFRVTPTVISLLDYSKGFGHTELVTC